MRKCCLVASFHFVEFLRADRFLVVEILVTLECRFGESEVGVRRDYFLLGCTLGCRCAVDGRPRLGIIDYRQHLSALYAVPFMNADLHDVAHHLAGELAGLRGVHRSHRFQAYRVRLPAEPASTDMLRTVSGVGGVAGCSLEQPLSPPARTKQRNETWKIECTIHGITTGD